MNTLILAIALSGGVDSGFWYDKPPRQVVEKCPESEYQKLHKTHVMASDPYGYLRIYTENNLTVDKTWRNEMILKNIKRKHNNFYTNSFSNPMIETHNGNGYHLNFN